MHLNVSSLKALIVSHEGDRSLVAVEVLDVLTRAACDMAKDKHSSATVKSRGMHCHVTTEFDTIGLGQFFGIKFTALLNYDDGDEDNVIFMVSRSQLERGADDGGRWVSLPSDLMYEILFDGVNIIDEDKKPLLN